MNHVLFLIVLLGAGTWSFLTIRNIVRSIASGSILFSLRGWTMMSWMVRPQTIYRDEDALGFWILVFAKGLFAALLIGISLVSLLGALVSN